MQSENTCLPQNWEEKIYCDLVFSAAISISNPMKFYSLIDNVKKRLDVLFGCQICRSIPKMRNIRTKLYNMADFRRSQLGN